jgi:hypothetical protein
LNFVHKNSEDRNSLSPFDDDWDFYCVSLESVIRTKRRMSSVAFE